MKSQVFIALLLGGMFSPSALFGQQQRCHTMEHMEIRYQQNPELRAYVKQVRDDIRNLAQQQPVNADRVLITIPVVVHVMHKGTSVGSSMNISTAQILSQIDVLNEDYQKMNSDISQVPAHFQSVAGNAEIEFCMASVDPNGNPTTGIERINMGSGNWNDNLMPGTIWDRNKYLNIYTADLDAWGYLGYSSFPGDDADYDAIVVDYRYFGRTPDNPFNNDFNLGRTTTHEVGHWLGLEHTFEGGCAGTTATNCSFGGDGICDTPPTQSDNYGCNLSVTRNTCTETPVDQYDMWMNYMDYVDDACMYMFTQGQAAVMQAVLNTHRASIKTSLACGTGNTFGYLGKVVDAGTGAGVPNARVLFTGDYEFEVGTDGAGEFEIPNFREGNYTVYAGKWGYKTQLYSSSLNMQSGSPAITIPISYGQYYDDFIMDYGWTVSGNAAAGIWERGIPIGTNFNNQAANPDIDVTGDYGDKCYVTGNAGGSAGNDDVDNGNTILTSPVFDLTDWPEPTIKFFAWFYNAGGNSSPNDELTIKLTNGADVVTVETIDASTTGSNQWVQKEIVVNDYMVRTANMQLILETGDVTGSGNIVEAGLDLFKIEDPTVGIYTLKESKTTFSLMPNPSSGQVLLQLDKSVPEQATLEIRDLSGKRVYNALLEKGTTIASLNLSSLQAGLYMVHLRSSQFSVTRRLVLTQ